MKGDFSKLQFDPTHNYSGVLHQQGRALLDQDWNAANNINSYLRQQQGRDTIGAGVAAVPAETPDSFKVVEAQSDGVTVNITLHPGRVWVDGMVLQVPGSEPYSRPATYFAPPIQDPQADPTTIAEGVRDAVILEVWEEAFNAFQDPLQLIEPALGGVDTTERVKLFHHLRLLRLESGEDCHDLAGRLVDDFDAKGKLTVSATTVDIEGECPVELGGGYTGFEHYLFRIEIAQADAANNARFKYSRFNGGLVGRGTYSIEKEEVTIVANDQMINHCGLSNFYLEALKAEPDGGHWEVVFTAVATLSADGKLSLTNTNGTWSGGEMFFRLWDGIALIEGFPTGSATPNELVPGLGIRLELDAPTAGNTNYTPGDYWTFPVRTAGVDFDPVVWPTNAPPQGVHYHRVPLAILNWDDTQDISRDNEQIGDCRDVFRPLTNQTVCCSYTVGDGHATYGDFDSIEEAIRHLPPTGGEVCLLSGLHEANVVIQNRHNIKIKGCGRQTRVIPRAGNRQAPIFQITDSRTITLEQMDLVSLEGKAIVLLGSKLDTLRDIEILHNRILAYDQAIQVLQGTGIHIRRNRIRMLDKEEAGVGIFILAEDSCIESNDIGVVPAGRAPLPGTGSEPLPDPTDPCADLEITLADPNFMAFVEQIFVGEVGFLPIAVIAPYRALGGIQISAASERVKVQDNTIDGGAGNGVTLGGVAPAPEPVPENEDSTHIIQNTGQEIQGFVEDTNGRASAIGLAFKSIDSGLVQDALTDNLGKFFIKAEPGQYWVSITTPGYQIQNITQATGSPLFIIEIIEVQQPPDDQLAFLYDIQIDRNEIKNMGLSGIGVPRLGVTEPVPGPAGASSRNFTKARLVEQLGNPVLGLILHRNNITQCLLNPFEGALRVDAKEHGYGGISLRYCEDITISSNHIEQNGINHINPACGIFITLGEHVEIHHNQINNNGPIVQKPGPDLEPGIRGGIVINVSSFGFNDTPGRQDLGRKSGYPAARINGNVVHQPVGQALRVAAVGPVSVCNNNFSSALSGPEAEEILVGAVFIGNNGNDDALPSGIILFNNNQTHLAIENTSKISQVLYSSDDLGFDANQSYVPGNGFKYSDNAFGLLNTYLRGNTLRASDNRFKERPCKTPESTKRSLHTSSASMNNTSNNQGDHPIIVYSATLTPIDTGNQYLDDGLCKQAGPVTGKTSARFRKSADL